MNKTKDGNYDVADIYDIAGGAMWGNKTDNILAIHRPKYLTDPTDTLVEVHIKKIKKQKLVGIPGVCEFDFSRKENRYFRNNRNPLSERGQQEYKPTPMTGNPTPDKFIQSTKESLDAPF